MRIASSDTNYLHYGYTFQHLRIHSGWKSPAREIVLGRALTWGAGRAKVAPGYSNDLEEERNLAADPGSAKLVGELQNG